MKSFFVSMSYYTSMIFDYTFMIFVLFGLSDVFLSRLRDFYQVALSPTFHPHLSCLEEPPCCCLSPFEGVLGSWGFIYHAVSMQQLHLLMQTVALTCMGAVFSMGVATAEKLWDVSLWFFLLHILALAALFGVEVFSAGVILKESFTILSLWLSN